MNAAFTDAWDSLQPTDSARRLHARVVASNDHEVVVLYRQGGVDSAGRVCDSEVLALYTVDEGKVVRLQMFYFEPEKISRFLNEQARRRTAEYDAQRAS
jgi:ketosteroid isomerase-like protein